MDPDCVRVVEGGAAEAISFVNARPKPLAAYVFSDNRDVQRQVIEPGGSPWGKSRRVQRSHGALR